MDKLQKVRKEIERRKAINSGGKDSEYMRGVMACYSEVLAIFDFDFGEEPVSEDLEKSALLYYPKMSRISEPHGVIPADNESHYIGDANEDNRKAFKNGAKWQKEQMMTKAIEGVINY